MNREFTCIVCPRGCHITVGEANNVSGNLCPRGKNYVLKEMTSPERTLTSSIRITNRNNCVVSVKTSKPIPKGKIFEMMDVVNRMLDQSLEMFVSGDMTHMQSMSDMENQVDFMELELTKRHIRRLREGKCTAQAGIYFSDTVSGLERVADHATNIAFSMLEARNGRHSASAFTQADHEGSDNNNTMRIRQAFLSDRTESGLEPDEEDEPENMQEMAREKRKAFEARTDRKKKKK